MLEITHQSRDKRGYPCWPRPRRGPPRPAFAVVRLHGRSGGL